MVIWRSGDPWGLRTLFHAGLKAKQRPSLGIGAGERGGKAFPYIGGQGVGIAHHQNPRRGKKPLEREDLPEFGRQFVVAPENMPFPPRIGMGTKKLLHLLAEELPVWAYAKAEPVVSS